MTTSASKKPLLPAALRLVWLEVILLTALSLLFLLLEQWRHVSPDAYRALSPPGQHFTDFTLYHDAFPSLFHTRAFFQQDFPFTYPAPIALVYEAFFRLFPANPILPFLVFSAAALLLPWPFFLFALRRQGVSLTSAALLVVTLAACSWPALLIWDRGNMEVCVWLALVFATWTFSKGHLKGAAALFGVAAAMKLFPIVLLGLFLSMRRWSALAVGIGVFLAVSLVSLAILGPTVPIAYRGIAEGLHFFQQNYMETWRRWENGVDHSLFALVKYLMLALFHHPENRPFETSLTVYTAFTAIGGILLFLWRIRLLPLLNQLLILIVVSIFFTAFSGDGTLIHLYYPFAFLLLLAVDAAQRGVRVPGLRQALCLLAFLVTYEGFFVHHDYRREGQVKAVALGWLLLVALRYNFGPPLRLSRDGTVLAHPDATLIRQGITEASLRP